MFPEFSNEALAKGESEISSWFELAQNKHVELICKKAEV